MMELSAVEALVKLPGAGRTAYNAIAFYWHQPLLDKQSFRVCLASYHLYAQLPIDFQVHHAMNKVAYAHVD